MNDYLNDIMNSSKPKLGDDGYMTSEEEASQAIQQAPMYKALDDQLVRYGKGLEEREKQYNQYQSDRISAFDYLQKKKDEKGWKGLSPHQKNFYRNNYQTIIPNRFDLDNQGTLQGELPTVYVGASRYKGKGEDITMNQIVNDGLAITGSVLTDVAETLEVPYAAAAHLIDKDKGRESDWRDIFPHTIRKNPIVGFGKNTEQKQIMKAITSPEWVDKNPWKSLGAEIFIPGFPANWGGKGWKASKAAKKLADEEALRRIAKHNFTEDITDDLVSEVMPEFTKLDETWKTADDIWKAGLLPDSEIDDAIENLDDIALNQGKKIENQTLAEKAGLDNIDKFPNTKYKDTKENLELRDEIDGIKKTLAYRAGLEKSQYNPTDDLETLNTEEGYEIWKRRKKSNDDLFLRLRNRQNELLNNYGIDMHSLPNFPKFGKTPLSNPAKHKFDKQPEIEELRDKFIDKITNSEPKPENPMFPDWKTEYTEMKGRSKFNWFDFRQNETDLYGSGVKKTWRKSNQPEDIRPTNKLLDEEAAEMTEYYLDKTRQYYNRKKLVGEKQKDADDYFLELMNDHQSGMDKPYQNWDELFEAAKEVFRADKRAQFVRSFPGDTYDFDTLPQGFMNAEEELQWTIRFGARWKEAKKDVAKMKREARARGENTIFEHYTPNKVFLEQEKIDFIEKMRLKLNSDRLNMNEGLFEGIEHFRPDQPKYYSEGFEKAHKAKVKNIKENPTHKWKDRKGGHNEEDFLWWQASDYGRDKNKKNYMDLVNKQNAKKKKLDDDIEFLGLAIKHQDSELEHMREVYPSYEDEVKDMAENAYKRMMGITDNEFKVEGMHNEFIEAVKHGFTPDDYAKRKEKFFKSEDIKSGRKDKEKKMGNLLKERDAFNQSKGDIIKATEKELAISKVRNDKMQKNQHVPGDTKKHSQRYIDFLERKLKAQKSRYTQQGTPLDKSTEKHIPFVLEPQKKIATPSKTPVDKVEKELDDALKLFEKTEKDKNIIPDLTKKMEIPEPELKVDKKKVDKNTKKKNIDPDKPTYRFGGVVPKFHDGGKVHKHPHKKKPIYEPVDYGSLIPGGMKYPDLESTRVEKTIIDPKKMNKLKWEDKGVDVGDLIPKRKPIHSGHTDELFADDNWDKNPTIEQQKKTMESSKAWYRRWNNSDMAKDMLTASYASDPDLDPKTARARALDNLRDRNTNLQNLNTITPYLKGTGNSIGKMYGGDVHQKESNPYKLFPGMGNQMSMNDRVLNEYIKTLSPQFVFKNRKMTMGPPDEDEIMKTFPAPENKMKRMDISQKRFDNLLTAKLYRDLYKDPANIEELKEKARQAKIMRDVKRDKGETFRSTDWDMSFNESSNKIYLSEQSGPTTAFHETGHVNTDASALIPNQDIRTLQEEMPASLNRPGEKKMENIIIREKDDGSYFIANPSDYVPNPEEEWVRFKRMQFEAEKLNKKGFKIYNPFKEKATMHDVQQLKKSSNSNIKDLFRHYSDEYILKVLNTVAERSNNKTDKYKNIS